MNRLAFAGALIVALLLGGCSNGVGSGPGGETTCQQWLALDDTMSAEERLSGKENKEQQDIVRRMLDKHGKDTGEYNRSVVTIDIIQFCFPDGTGTRPNLNRPIDGAVDW